MESINKPMKSEICNYLNPRATGVRMFLLALTLFLGWSGSSQAQTAGQIEAALEILKDVDAQDLPWKSVELVGGAPENAKKSVAAAVIQAVALMRMESTPACVGAIAAQTPEVAMSALASGLEHAPGFSVVTCVTVGSLKGVNWRDVEAIAIASAENSHSARRIQAVLRQLNSTQN